MLDFATSKMSNHYMLIYFVSQKKFPFPTTCMRSCYCTIFFQIFHNYFANRRTHGLNHYDGTRAIQFGTVCDKQLELLSTVGDKISLNRDSGRLSDNNVLYNITNSCSGGILQATELLMCTMAMLINCNYNYSLQHNLNNISILYTCKY